MVYPVSLGPGVDGSRQLRCGGLLPIGYVGVVVLELLDALEYRVLHLADVEGRTVVARNFVDNVRRIIGRRRGLREGEKVPEGGPWRRRQHHSG